MTQTETGQQSLSLDELSPAEETIPLKSYSEKAYLEYSMYVILNRALPHIADGLKPVQRRIVYAMSELGLNAGAKHKKAARTVGDVIGKFHPHGDSSVYSAMALLAQDFSTRYTLIDGQGNWGSADDPSSFAAMRYTEAKLTPFASKTLLEELNQGTVDWQANFDGTLEEPQLLPAQAPLLLLNGASGIAVGMSADIPSHNLREVVAACVALLKNPSSSLEEICAHILGPDLPTAAEIITPHKELIEMYRSGRGRFKARATWHIEDGCIVITALPYLSSPARVLEKIGQQMSAGKLPMLTDIRDESNHENPVRLVLEPRSNRVDKEQLMLHLCSTTEIERVYNFNCNVIGIDGRPTVKPLKTVLSEWLKHRDEVVRRRLSHRLEQVAERLHALDGLLIAHLSIDEVIAIIRTEDQADQALIERFGLTELQAKTILEIRLRQLSRLEEVKLRAEQDELNKERKHIETTLNSKARLKALMTKELQAIDKKFGDERRSPLKTRDPAAAISDAQLIKREALTILISRQGWVRAGRGHNNAIELSKLSYKAGDAFLDAVQGYSDTPIIALDSTGRGYTFMAHSLPSVRSHGEPLISHINLSDQARFVALMSAADGEMAVLCGDSGYGFIVECAQITSRNRNGKVLLHLSEGASPLRPACFSQGQKTFVAALASSGRMLVFELQELAQMTQGKGTKMLDIPKMLFAAGEERMCSVVALAEHDELRVHTAKRYLRLQNKDWLKYKAPRGRRGHKLPKGFQTALRLEVISKPAAN